MHTAKTVEAFLGLSRDLLSEVETFVSSKIPNEQVIIDHIGYKCASSSSYEAVRALFEGESRFIYQSIISQRRIAVIGLRTPIPSIVGGIHVLELADQKPDGSQAEGFEHVEIFSPTIPYDELVAIALKNGAVVEKKDRPHHTTEDVRLLPGCTVKFTRDQLVEKIKRQEMVCFPSINTKV